MFHLSTVLMVKSGWLVVTVLHKDELKFVYMEHGVLSVMRVGEHKTAM